MNYSQDNIERFRKVFPLWLSLGFSDDMDYVEEKYMGVMVATLRPLGREFDKRTLFYYKKLEKMKGEPSPRKLKNLQKAFRSYRKAMKEVNEANEVFKLFFSNIDIGEMLKKR